MQDQADVHRADLLSRRDFVRASMGGASTLALGRFALAEETTWTGKTSDMNILFIVVEDWSTAGLRCFGNDIVKTPHVDAFARSGVRFNRAYCSVPICNPSRTSLCTGLRPDTTGVYGNADIMNRHLPAEATHIAELLKSRGAFVAAMGKLYHKTYAAEKQLAAFDRLEFCKLPKGYEGISKGFKLPPGTPPPLEKSWKYSPDPKLDAELKRLRQERDELEKRYPPGTPGRHEKVYKAFYQKWTELLGDSGEREEHTYDGKIARCAAGMLREFAADGRQFFLSVGLHAPHTPLLAPKKYVDMYDPDKMPMPSAPPDRDRNIPAVACSPDQNYDLFIKQPQTPERVRKAIASYYACSSFVDAQIGVVLDALAKTHLADNTIVVLFADHGFHLGEHGRWSKYSLFEQSTRVPMIVRVPGAAGNGRTCNEIVELVDLLPTLTDLWAIKPPPNCEGTSFRPLVHDPGRPWKKAALTMLSRGKGLGRSVRTKRHRYTEWRSDKSKPGETQPQAVELYDLQTEPWEQNNLAGGPKHEATQRTMSDMLRAGWRSALPPERT